MYFMEFKHCLKHSGECIFIRSRRNRIILRLVIQTAGNESKYDIVSKNNIRVERIFTRSLILLRGSCDSTLGLIWNSVRDLTILKIDSRVPIVCTKFFFTVIRSEIFREQRIDALSKYPENRNKHNN